jgi:hypothetical protein
MKQIITIFALGGITIMASCSSSDMKEREAALVASQNTIDSMKIELVRQRVIDSMNEVSKVEYLVPQLVSNGVSEKPKARRTSTRRSSSSGSSSGGSYSGGSSSGGSVAQTQTSPVYQPAPVYQEAPAPVPEKKGWSAKAKGAVIGAGTGAAAGAIINKRNRVAGAIIGGVLGAGAGTGIGAIIDKKNGR